MRVLVVGASGYAGRHVARRAVELGATVTGTFRSRPLDIPGVTWHPLDLRADIDTVTRAAAPDVVINAAYASAAEPEHNWSVNALGAVRVAAAATAAGARLVHISTDALHSHRDEPLTEADEPRPVYPYGAAKAAAEVGIGAVAPDAVLVRTSLITSDPTVGGVRTEREDFMLDMAAGRTPPAAVLFTDDIRRPIAVTDLAAALVELASSDHAGVINVAGPDAASFYDLGVLVVRRFGGDPAGLRASTIATAGVRRPGNVQLDSSLAGTLLRTRLRGVKELFA
jgi:dTDP-4-dehydrorhamnose reductase